MAPPLDALLALASGVPLAVLGVLLMASQPVRRDALFLGAFGVLWGAQVVATNAGRVLENPGLGVSGLLVGLALVPAAHVCLARFALLHWPGRGADAATWAFVAAAAGGALLLLAAPAAVVAAAPGGGVSFGPAATPLFIVPFYAAFGLALVATYRASLHAPDEAARRRARGFATGFALFTGYVGVRQAAVYLSRPDGIPAVSDPAAWTLVALFASGVALHAGLLAHQLLAPRARSVPLALALLVPALWAAAERALAGPAAELDSTGLWRLAALGAVVSTHARHEVVSALAALREKDARLQARLEDIQALQGEVEARNRALAEANAQLGRSNRDLESFVHAVSHDLRAPLFTVRAISQALEEDHAAKLDAEGRAWLGRLGATAERMDGLIEGLLWLSRAGRRPLRVEAVDLSALAAAAVEELRQREPSREVEVRIEPGLVAAGDAALLQIVLRNLLENAWKYSARARPARIAFGRSEDGAFVVQDNGVGFDMAEAGRLFRPFQRLSSASDFRGDGIGLATVQRIVERHGGRVWATGEPGRGAAFRFTLPPVRRVPVEARDDPRREASVQQLEDR